jgi:tetratricopeptide (TPR) repeat protein
VAGSTAETEATAREQIKALRQEAVEVATRLLQDFPHSAEALIIVGNMHAALGNSAAALQSWERSLELDPQRADVYQGMGEVALTKGEFDQALTLWRKAQEIDPKMPGVHCSLARALMNLRRPQEAVVELEKELEISPGSGLSHYLLGQAYLQVEEYERARQNYEKVIEIQPELWNAYYGLATVYARLGQADKSQEYREKFKKLKSEELKVTHDRSVAYDDLLVVRRDVVGVYIEVGRLYQQGENPSTAERHWLRAAALDPKNVRCREYLAGFYQANRREAEAVEMCRQLREIDPKNPVYCVRLGIAHTRLERFEDAEKAFVEAQQLAPQRSLGYRALAQLYLHAKKNLAEARALARKAVELEPLALNYSVLSEAYDKSGDRPGALEALRQAMQLDPDNERYRRIYEQLQRE